MLQKGHSQIARLLYAVSKNIVVNKRGQEDIWKELLVIIIILIAFGVIIYATWQILPK